MNVMFSYVSVSLTAKHQIVEKYTFSDLKIYKKETYNHKYGKNTQQFA